MMFVKETSKHQVQQPKSQVHQTKHQVRQTKHQVGQPKHQVYMPKKTPSRPTKTPSVYATKKNHTQVRSMPNNSNLYSKIFIHAVLSQGNFLSQIYALFWRTFYKPEIYGSIPKMTNISFPKTKSLCCLWSPKFKLTLSWPLFGCSGRKRWWVKKVINQLFNSRQTWKS